VKTELGVTATPGPAQAKATIPIPGESEGATEIAEGGLGPYMVETAPAQPDDFTPEISKNADCILYCSETDELLIVTDVTPAEPLQI
jgi:hypothetical protein